jgi:hypothetical protein
MATRGLVNADVAGAGHHHRRREEPGTVDRDELDRCAERMDRRDRRKERGA